MKDKHMIKFLKWIKKYSGWWYLICTPGEEHMTIEMMRNLMIRLKKESLYELIFVMLMVHRNAPFMDHIYEYAWMENTISKWNTDKEKIINFMIDMLE